MFGKIRAGELIEEEGRGTRNGYKAGCKGISGL